MTSVPKKLPLRLKNFQDEQIFPYFFRNALVNANNVYLLQQANSIPEALYIIQIWNTEHYNIGTSPNNQVLLDIPYTKYLYNSNTDIERVRVIPTTFGDDRNTMEQFLKEYGVLIYKKNKFVNILALLPYTTSHAEDAKKTSKSQSIDEEEFELTEETDEKESKDNKEDEEEFFEIVSDEKSESPSSSEPELSELSNEEIIDIVQTLSKKLKNKKLLTPEDISQVKIILDQFDHTFLEDLELFGAKTMYKLQDIINWISDRNPKFIKPYENLNSEFY